MPASPLRWVKEILLKKLVYLIVGIFSYPGITLFNRLRISGTEHLKGLPPANVLFVSNHQTYFADVITFLHIFSAVKWGKMNHLGIPYYLLNPFTRVNFIAAAETMKSNWISRIFRYGGALLVNRTWRESGKETQRALDPKDTEKILQALWKNWVITFPQGTTRPFAPGRKGTAYIIKETKPIVIPVVIRGFWRAFNKQGLKLKKKGTTLSVTFKEPLRIDYNAPAETILNAIMEAIEQSREFMMKGSHHWLPGLSS
jgi:1-acyl-sn-glycerol-3-phosphate acyltransferase